MNIGILILMIVGGGVGILSSLYIALSFPAMIIWKIYRKTVMDINLHTNHLFYGSVQILFYFIQI